MTRLGFLCATTLVGSLACVHAPDEETRDSPELAAVRRVAQTVERNDLGYWEADLGNGHFLVHVPTGAFEMGAHDGEPFELPVHTVQLSGFWIAKFPVTVAQFRAFVDDTGFVTDAEQGEGCWVEGPGHLRYDANWRTPYVDQRDDEPVLCVSWNDAMAYAAWMGETTGLPFTLPTEAQWERAARGSDGRAYPWGNAAPDGSQANFADSHYKARFPDRRDASVDVDDGHAQTSPVDAYPGGRSPYGVYDMAGNTIDWLYDWYDGAYYAASPSTDPAGPQRDLVRHKFSTPGGWGSNLQRAIRGGAWTDASGQLSLEEGGHSIRSDRRESTDQYSSDDHLSFRLAVDVRRPALDLEAERAAVPVPDERAVVAERIGDAEVSFQYRRAAVDGRERALFGLEVAYGEPWSIGAPNPALFSTSDDILVEGQPLGPGFYALEIIPEEIVDAEAVWTLVFREWQGRAGAGAEVLRVPTHAQLEDNSKEHLEVFFDTRGERGVIARVLWEFVEVHVALAAPHGVSAQAHLTGEPAARVVNAIGSRELALDYPRQFAEAEPVFGGSVPFDKPWEFGEGGAVLEVRGDLTVGGQRLRAGRYEFTLVPRAEGPWVFHARPLSDQTLAADAVALAVEVDTGDESNPRLEFYFDHTSEGGKVLVMAWGDRLARVAVEE